MKYPHPLRCYLFGLGFCSQRELLLLLFFSLFVLLKANRKIFSKCAVAFLSMNFNSFNFYLPREPCRGDDQFDYQHYVKNENAEWLGDVEFGRVLGLLASSLSV